MLESQKHELLHEVIQLQGMIGQIQKEIKEEYGDVDINISDGSIKYNKNEQVNS